MTVTWREPLGVVTCHCNAAARDAMIRGTDTAVQLANERTIMDTLAAVLNAVRQPPLAEVMDFAPLMYVVRLRCTVQQGMRVILLV